MWHEALVLLWWRTHDYKHDVLCVLFFFHHRVVLLLLSSGYIGLRIVALEKQLTSLGALPEFSLRSGYEFLSLKHTPRAVKGKPKALEWRPVPQYIKAKIFDKEVNQNNLTHLRNALKLIRFLNVLVTVNYPVSWQRQNYYFNVVHY